MSTRVAAVVANWNGGPENVACVEALVANGIATGDVVFVDNGSQDGSADLVARACPGVTIVRNTRNLGFGEASNQGARLALERGATHVFFVNNDVIVPARVVERLVRELRSNVQLGIVGPRVLFQDEPALVWCAGGMLTWTQNLSTLLGHKQKDDERWRAVHDVDYVPGCALLATRAVLEKAGMFDPLFFAYMEDVDLCLRARQHGFGVRVVGDVAALHAASSSTGGGYNPRRKWMMGVNSIWFLRRHAHTPQWLRFVVFDVLTLPFLWIAALFRGEGKSVIAKGVGILDGLRGKRVTPESVQAGASWLW